MNTYSVKRITIIGDNDVGYRIVDEVVALGATGYTYDVVHGKGDRGIRPRHTKPPNARIEVVATKEVAEKIMEHIATNYFGNYAMIAFLDDVQVIRGPKFGAKIITEG